MNTSVNSLLRKCIIAVKSPPPTIFRWPSQAARDLAIYYSTLSPKAANDGDRELIAAGRSIYQEGMPDDNIVACVVCHGPNAEGVRQIPRLGGLPTLIWSGGLSNGAKAIMQPRGRRCRTSPANCRRTKLTRWRHIWVLLSNQGAEGGDRAAGRRQGQGEATW
jgi:cytochrome c peroxidase